MTITTVAPTIDTSGITAPSYPDILAKVQADYQAIVGADVYIDPDSQDGQNLALTALAINDCNNAVLAAYASRGPVSAQGEGLSSVVKINGLARLVSSYSTAAGTVTGTAGTVILNGRVTDAAGLAWSLPSSVTIGSGGTASVTITCSVLGANAAAINTITGIDTPTFGWTAFTNTAAASLGSPVELDSALRYRQSISTAVASQTILDGIIAATAAVVGVTRVRGYENVTNSTDANGIPAGNISLWVENGANLAIGTAIAFTKPPGTPTYGGGSPVTQSIVPSAGSSVTINFGRPTDVTVAVALSIKQIVNGVPITSGSIPASTLALITSALQTNINSGRIGLGVVSFFGLVPSAALTGNLLSSTYEVSAMTINKNGGSFSAADIALAYNEVSVAGAVTITVL